MPFHITTSTRAVAGSSTIYDDIKDTLFEVVMDRLWYQSNGMLYFCGDTIGWVTSRTHSSITYSTSIVQEIGHYPEGAGKTMIVILADIHILPMSNTSNSFHNLHASIP